jgi:hypothetical protein
MKILEIFTTLCMELHTLNKHLEVLNRSNEKPHDRTKCSSEETLKECMRKGAELLKRSEEAFRRKKERERNGDAA